MDAAHLRTIVRICFVLINTSHGVLGRTQICYRKHPFPASLWPRRAYVQPRARDSRNSPIHMSERSSSVAVQKTKQPNPVHRSLIPETLACFKFRIVSSPHSGRRIRFRRWHLQLAALVRLFLEMAEATAGSYTHRATCEGSGRLTGYAPDAGCQFFQSAQFLPG
jgi:hypothetical protein